MGIIEDVLKNYAGEYRLNLDDTKVELLERYAEILVEWNKKINLTAIVEPYQVAIKHFLDSLAMLKFINIPESGALIDIGTGAGFPGVPIKILRSDIKLTLVDSRGKRITFLKHLLEELDIEAEVKQDRAEELANFPEYREKFDVATSRAVASMNILSEYCLPFLKIGGFFVALKSSDVDAELANANSAIQTLGGKLIAVNKFELPDDNPRAIVCVEKISSTNTKYPRDSAKIMKNPL